MPVMKCITPSLTKYRQMSFYKIYEMLTFQLYNFHLSCNAFKNMKEKNLYENRNSQTIFHHNSKVKTENF